MWASCEARQRSSHKPQGWCSNRATLPPPPPHPSTPHPATPHHSHQPPPDQAAHRPCRQPSPPAAQQSSPPAPREVRSFVTPTISETLPSAAAPSTTTPDPSLPAQRIHQLPHLRLLQPIHPLRQHLHALHLNSRRTRIRQRSRSRLHPNRIQLPPQLLHLLFLRRNPMPQRIRRRHALRRRTHQRPTTFATSKSRRNSCSAPVPLTASTRRTPEDTDPSPTILINPISPVAPV